MSPPLEEDPSVSARRLSHISWAMTPDVVAHSKPPFPSVVEGHVRLDGAVPSTVVAPDPQAFTPLKSRYLIWLTSAAATAVSSWYLWWRITSTRLPPGALSFAGFDFSDVYWWSFLVSECLILLSMVLMYSQRFFPISRVVCTADELVAADAGVASLAKVAVVVPTAGEKLSVVLRVLLGATSQRVWETSSALPASKVLRVVVMDEAHRVEVFKICTGLHAVAKLLHTREVRRIMMVEGVGFALPESKHMAPDIEAAASRSANRGKLFEEQRRQLTPLAFYEWIHLAGGFHRQNLYNSSELKRAVDIMRVLDELVLSTEGKLAIYDKLQAVYMSKTPLTDSSSLLPEPDDGVIAPGYTQLFDNDEGVLSIVYHSRKDAGMPAASPKAGNLNAALFPAAPGQERLIGDATLLVVNDCRHALAPMFLQRTVPYLFQLHKQPQETSSTYEWADKAFVQTPQRFPQLEAMRADPLGNHSRSQYDISFVGKDGVGATPSAGHGCVWRVDALLGRDPNGLPAPGNPQPEALTLKDDMVGSKAGFRAEVLIEDTHTSMELFRRGWRSVFINEPGETLSQCVQQPDSLQWRLRQLLRWHQGAVELLLHKGLSFALLGRWPTFWARLYCVEILTYYLYAIPGYAILWMPVVFGLSGVPPFYCTFAQVGLHLLPFLLASQLPTIIARTWHKVDSLALLRDETVWLSTLHVMIYALVSVLLSSLKAVCCQGKGRAWVQEAPVWPLFATFAALVTALAATTFQLSVLGYSQYGITFVCSLVPIIWAMVSLWPQIDLHLPHGMPTYFTLKFCIIAFLCVLLFAVAGGPNTMASKI